MKRTLVAAWVVGICMMGLGVEVMAQEVTTLIRVNTDDTAAYLAWAEESMPIVMAAAGADPLVGGGCVERRLDLRDRNRNVVGLNVAFSDDLEIAEIRIIFVDAA